MRDLDVAGVSVVFDGADAYAVRRESVWKLAKLPRNARLQCDVARSQHDHAGNPLGYASRYLRFRPGYGKLRLSQAHGDSRLRPHSFRVHVNDPDGEVAAIDAET